MQDSLLVRYSKIFAAFCLITLLALTSCHEASALNELKRGDIVFDLDKADRSTLKLPAGFEWSKEGENGGECLKATIKDGQAKDTVFLSIPVDISKWRGMQVALTCRVRTEKMKVSESSVKWLGSKYHLHWKSAKSGTHYLDVESFRDDSPWAEIVQMGVVDDDAESGGINIGIQKASGTTWFSQVKIIVSRLPASERVPQPDFKTPTTTMRGVMSPTKFKEKDFEDLEKWKVNLIRWQLVRTGEKNRKSTDLEGYDQWFNGKLDELEQVLNSAQKHGIKVVIDLHSSPGGRDENKSLRIFTTKIYRDHFIKNWERIAKRYGGHPAIWGYDIINEPVQYLPSSEVPEDYLGVQVAAAKAIRAIDPKTPIIIAADQWSSPPAFKWLEPVDLPNVIYQVHMYWPIYYTHQGVKSHLEDKDTKWMVNYPGTYTNKPFDKNALREQLAPVLQFQKAYNARIYVGEFSAARWAPGSAQYIDDCISIFEEYGWDWTFHAFRESPIWSVEHVDSPRENPTPSKEPTDRELVLKKWLSKNQ